MVLDHKDAYRRRLIFLGTGPAWRSPELGCSCPACQKMRKLGERRTRTSLWIDGPTKIMVDCGPDAADQLEQNGLDKPDVILITHEHGDHYLGLDDLEPFRRRAPVGGFTPIPCWAHPAALETIKIRFGYLEGKLLNMRPARPNYPLDGWPDDEGLTVTPFKTNHGPMPRGAVGYIFDLNGGDRSKRLVYTSDFFDVPEPPPELEDMDILVASCQWLNEPVENFPHHMSLARLVEFVALWRPRERVFLVHLSGDDLGEDEKEGVQMKKRLPRNRFRDPQTGEPMPAPLCQEEWQLAAELVFKTAGLDVPVTVARDGLVVDIWG